MKKILLMCGLSGSGKLTIAKKMVSDGKYDCIISSDSIREELSGTVYNKALNGVVFGILRQRLIECLKADKSCIVDATNLTYKERQCYVSIAKNNSCEIDAYVVNTPYRLCLERTQARKDCINNLPLEALNKQVCRFNMPQLFEGFKSVIIHQCDISTSGVDFNETVDRMKGFDQKNHWHKLTLDNHCKLAGVKFSDYFKKKRAEVLKGHRVHSSQYKPMIYYQIGCLHDIGKLFTQTFDDKGEAHYYNHESVSTYYILTHPRCIAFKYYTDFLFELFIINNHMHIRDILKNEKTIQKYKDLWGSLFYDELVAFENCDANSAKWESNSKQP